VLAGFAKCGTSTLADLLVSHPAISWNRGAKEPHTYSLTNRYIRRHDIKDIQEESIYSIDASTSYAPSKLALTRLHLDNPSAKILFICRDPIERVISHYNWYSKMGLRLLPINDELKVNTGDWSENDHINYNWKYFIESSSYAKHILRAKEIFESVKIVYLEDLERDQANTMQSVFTWLNLQAEFDSSKKHVANKTDELNRKSGVDWAERVRHLPRTLVKVIDYYVEPFLLHGAFKLHNRRAIHSLQLSNQILELLHEDVNRYEDAGIDIRKFLTFAKVFGNDSI